MSYKPELKPCPICGEPVEIDGYKEGSCLDICCCVSMTLQKSDCLTMEERQTWVGDSENRIYRFSDQAEDKALADIVRRWGQRADLAKPSEWISVESKSKAFDFIQEHATRIHFDEACDSLIYSDKEHFTKDDWLLGAVEKATTL